MADSDTLNFAVAHHQAGRLVEAESGYRQVLAREPANDTALYMLGLIRSARGDANGAAELMERAASIRPTVPEIRINLALTYLEKGDSQRAMQAARIALALNPTNPQTLYRLGGILTNVRLLPESLDAFRRVLAMEPDHAGAMIGIGVALLQQNRAKEAIAPLEKALALSPISADAAHHLGHALLLAGRTDEAIACFQKAVELDPGVAESHCNLANAHATQLHFDQALASVNRALYLRPQLADAHWNKAMILLVQGNFVEGWVEYEWRWIKFAQHVRGFRQPLWDGRPIAGKTILLHAEQGIGDAIHFSRYVTDVARLGAKVVLEVQPPLVALMSRIAGVDRVLARGQPLPEFDLHCPLLSLPYALGMNSMEAVYARQRYLWPSDQTIERWRVLLKPFDGEMKVGIVWAGDPNQGRDFERSASPDVFLPLTKLSGVRLFSLQKAVSQPPPQTSGLNLIDFTSRLHDFSETAGLIANLDLVISVDTSVAHLAGAMGKPIWTMLAHYADWRYFLNRSDCPWYPTMRLFRQPAPRDWESVMKQIVAELESMLAQSTSTSPFMRG